MRRCGYLKIARRQLNPRRCCRCGNPERYRRRIALLPPGICRPDCQPVVSQRQLREAVCGFPNGTVDVFRGWVSSIGKAVTAKDVITRTVKVTNVGRPSMAEDRSTVTATTGMTVTPASTSVVKGQSTTLTVAFQPEGATDKSFRAVSADKTKATVSVSGMTITVKGVAAGKVNIPVVSGNGELAAVAEITVTAS